MCFSYMGRGTFWTNLVLCEYPVLERVKIQTMGSARYLMDLNQIKEVRLDGIVTFGKGVVELNSPL